MDNESPIKPSPHSPLPEKGEGVKKVHIHSRGGFSYSGLMDTARILRQKETDKLRDEYLKSEGFTIYRFKNHEVLNRPEIIFQAIKEKSCISSSKT